MINYQRDYLILILICIQGTLLASTKFESAFPANSFGSLNFTVDVCQLDGPGDSTTLEIIYSVFLVNENSIQPAEQNITTLAIDLTLSNKSGKLINKHIEDKSVSFDDTLNVSSFTTFMDIKKFYVKADTVLLDLKIHESQQGAMGRVSQLFGVRQFERDFSISDLYFASHVQRAQGSSVFEKGGIMFFPNPSRLFFASGNTPKIFVYYEINNLSYDANKPSFYEANSVVKDMTGNELFTNPRKQIKVTSQNTSRIQVIPIAGFKSGVYSLVIEVIDIGTEVRREIGGYFTIEGGDTQNITILPMSETEKEKYLDQIKYIASNLEKETFNKLDAHDSQEFLLRFWKSKDPDPATPENEFMIEHFRRLAYVEREFKGGNSSDMGRVYIKYGPPADIERKTSMVSSAQAVQSWAYAIDGRTDFVFIDRDGDGKFVLVHSTHRDEYSNPNWRDSIN